MRKQTLLLVIAVLLLAGGRADAQLAEKRRAWSGQLAAGYSFTEGVLGDLFQSGFSLVGGATYHPRRAPWLGAFVEADYNGFDVAEAQLEQIGVANGDLRMWALTGGVSFEKFGKVGFFGSLGIGWYRREIDLLNPTAPTTVIACNPWWDFCAPVDVVFTQNIVGSRLTTGVGYNAGIGMTFRTGNGAQVYMEAKYHYVPNRVAPIEMIPFVVGYRW